MKAQTKKKIWWRTAAIVIIILIIVAIMNFGYKCFEVPLETDPDVISGRITDYYRNADGQLVFDDFGEGGMLFLFTEEGYPICLDTGGTSYIQKDSEIYNKYKGEKELMVILSHDVNGSISLNPYFLKIPQINLQNHQMIKDFYGALTEKVYFPCTLGINQLTESTLVVQRDHKFFICKNCPSEYAYKLTDIYRDATDGGRYNLDLDICGTKKSFKIDTGFGSPIAMEYGDSIFFKNIRWTTTSIISTFSTQKMRKGMATAHLSPTFVVDVTLGQKRLISPAYFFPYDVAIDFKNKAIYTKTPEKLSFSPC